LAASGIRVKFIFKDANKFATATYENATPQMVATELRISRVIKTDQGMMQTDEIINFEILTA
jgi:hypothetical protein